MSKLWVKLKPNDATRVSTEECHNVDDFLRACKKELQLCLSTTDGGPALESDAALPAQNTAMKPLFISVDLSSDSFKIDEIDLGTEHLERSKLVRRLRMLMSLNFIVLLNSPAASGKSSLFKLYKATRKKTQVFRVSFLDHRTPYEILREIGIDFDEEKISKNINRKKKVVVFLDDAQSKYGDVDFWVYLLKGTSMWLPDNIKFIISATHLLSAGIESPVEFQSLPTISRIDFLLTDEEAYQLLEFRDVGLPEKIRHHKILKDVLVKECGGLVGALRLAINSLKEEFSRYINEDVEEVLCLQYCLSIPFVRNMARCFGSGHSHPVGNDFKDFLKGNFANEKIWLDRFTNPQDNDSFSSLKKAGIVVKFPDYSFGFSSPLAKRYYFKWIFPNRSSTAPSSLSELIRNVVSNMSSTVLKKASIPGGFPKVAVFQYMFMEGLALNTPPGCSICPNLAKIFPSNTQHTIDGEIDIYLQNSSLRWGIELYVNENGIGEHVSRFTPSNGKYAPLVVNDYAVVDIRRYTTVLPTNISRNPNRISVFFNDEYSVAQCVFGDDTGIIEISLAN